MHTPNAREAFTSPYVWAFMLMSILAVGVGLGFWVMKRQSQAGPAYHVRPLAMMEAMVAIAAGVLLWMGFWDFIDVYLVPRQWWAKLCMVIVGALGSILTRSLYDEQLDYVHPSGGGDVDDPPRSPRSANLEEAPRRLPPLSRERSGSSSFSGMPPVLGSPVLSNSPIASRLRDLTAKRNSSAYAAITPEADNNVPTAQDDADDEAPPTRAPPNSAARGGASPARPRKYFDPPRFSCGRCTSSLLTILSGLTLWVGIWDLVDEHILPAIFTSCVKEPSAGCAAVKLSLICIGALGMYWTRSLYGDRMVQPSQFQPIA